MAAERIPPLPQQPKPSGDATYKFERGFPTKDTAQRAQDDADYQRALIAYRFWYPTVSLEGFFNGLRQIGIADNQSLAIGSVTPRWVRW